MPNLLIKVAYIVLIGSWPIVAGLIGFAIVAIADSAGNGWALIATLCVIMATIALALLGDLAGNKKLSDNQ